MASTEQTGRVACPHCGAMIKSAGLAAGAAVNCPKCGQGFRIGQEAVQSPKSKVQSQQAVEGRRTKDEGRKAVSGMPQPPPPPGAVQSPRPKVQGREGEAPAEPLAVHPKSAPGTPAQNPKPHPRDVLVDPNLLPPPPPRVKEKAKEVAVVCRLCGTRMYAPLEKIGQEVKCPDCHTRNEVPALKEEKGNRGQATGDRGQGTESPTLEGTEEFGMSEVVERPKYRPLVRGREEYDVLSATDPAAMEHRLSAPGQRPRAKGEARAATAEDERSDEDVEVTLAPVVEIAEAARDPRSFLPQPDIEPEDPMYDGRYDDGVIGDRVDPRSPDAWKQAPFVYGIVEFLIRSSTLLRLVMFAIGLAAVAMLVRVNVRLATSDEAPAQIMGLLIMWGTIAATAAWLLSFAAAFQAVVEATGNGDDEVATWPDWNILAWFGPCLYVGAAVLIAASPGALIAGWTLAVNIEDPLMAAFGMAAPVVISLMVLFPFIYSSMLVEDSVMAIVSPHTLRSLKIASEGWVFFYMYSLVLVFLASLAVAMVVAGQLPVRALGAAGTVAAALLYARLLGRLMWVAAQREAKSGNSP